MNDLSSEIKPLLNLNVDRSHNWSESTEGQAPHKPFLLLSILDRIEQGVIHDYKIAANDSNLFIRTVHHDIGSSGRMSNIEQGS
jgi:predicted restriction endonuclease